MSFLCFHKIAMSGKTFALGPLIDQARLVVEEDLANWCCEKQTSLFFDGDHSLGSEESRILRTYLNRLSASIYENWEELNLILNAAEIDDVLADLRQMTEISKCFPVVIWANTSTISGSSLLDEILSELPTLSQFRAYFDLPHCRRRVSSGRYVEFDESDETVAQKRLVVAIANFNRRKKQRRRGSG